MGASIQAGQFLIIAGSAKSGTTSLFDYLSQHPEICPSIKKEPEYFLQNRVRWRDVHRYEDFWPSFEPAVHRYALEASCRYTMRHDQGGVAERMRAYGIAPRLVYLVRDPVERIVSHVNHRIRHIRGQQSFEDPLVVETSRYAWQLEPYVENFGSESIRVVDFARLRADPNQVCAELYAWLGLMPHVISDPGVSNEGARVRTSHLERVPALKPVARRLPLRLHGPVKRIVQNVIPYRHQPVEISVDDARKIRALLKDDVSRLAREWGVDVTPWGFASVADKDA